MKKGHFFFNLLFVKKKEIKKSKIKLFLPSLSNQPNDPDHQDRNHRRHEKRQQARAQAPALSGTPRHGGQLSTGGTEPRSRRADVVVEVVEQSRLQLELVSDC